MWCVCVCLCVHVFRCCPCVRESRSYGELELRGVRQGPGRRASMCTLSRTHGSLRSTQKSEVSPSDVNVEGIWFTGHCSVPSDVNVEGIWFTVHCSLPSDVNVGGIWFTVHCSVPSHVNVEGIWFTAHCNEPI